MVNRDLRDEHCQLLAGSVSGWGAPGRFYEQRLAAAEMTPAERLGALFRYFQAAGEGREPPVPREESR